MTSKLTVDDVLSIKAHSRQESFVLSEKYRVTERTIRKIQRGNRWGWLTCGPERIHWEAKA